MSEEEKKAIDKLKHIVKESELYWEELTYKCPLYDGDTPIPIDEYKLILNLIEKQQTKIKELEADLYSANCTINDYIEERNKILEIMGE